MTTSITLNNPARLTRLIFDLEAGVGKNPELLEAARWNIIVTSSSDYRELLNLFIIPTRPVPEEVIRIREERDLWVNQIIGEIRNSPDLQFDDITLVTIVIPGDRPGKVSRFSFRQIRFRFLSAVEHLWSDRMRIDDIQERLKILSGLSTDWSNKDEEQFVEPAISKINEKDLSKTAADLLKDNDPSILDEGLTIIYGPGGIGKTHFMRRLVSRYSRRCARDLSYGIPVFAILPTLLHQDALETFLSKQKGLSNLSLDQIRALIRHQIIIPFLDAFDELVRGAVRDGCREFLISIGKLMSSGGAGVLTSRDYFLNVDPIIPSSLSKFEVAELSLGFFDRQGRRSFIHGKTGLPIDIVSRWSKSLEEQVEALFGVSANREIDSLVGHPLFMEALCNYIRSIPRSEVSRAADEFQFRTPSIFGEIVTRVLEREREKARLGWQAKFGDKFVDDWRYGPFSTKHQLQVLTYLSCRIAQYGSTETKKRYGKDWIHGLFDYQAKAETVGLDLRTLSGRKEAIQRLLHNIIGDAQLATSVTEEEAIDLRKQAEVEIAQFYLLHVLSDTEPDVPDGLIFATRNKAYFEYFLAQELVNKIHEALVAKDANKAIEWSDQHHIFDDFQDSLQFVLWDHRVGKEGYERLVDIFTGENLVDDTIASYCMSLGLALALQRNSARNQMLSLRDLSLAPDPRWRLELLSELLPAISRINLETISIPHLAINDTEIRNVELNNCDFGELKLVNCKLYEVNFRSVTCSSIQLAGTITFHNCLLQITDIENSNFIIERGATIHFTKCKLSHAFLKAIQEQPLEIHPQVIRQNCQEVADEDASIELEGLSKGSRFLHKLMNLLRKHGRATWGVYYFKLRGRTGLEAKFDDVLQIIIDREVVEVIGETVILRPEINKYMFDGKRRTGRSSINDHSTFWAPIVSEIDIVLG